VRITAPDKSTDLVEGGIRIAIQNSHPTHPKRNQVALSPKADEEGNGVRSGIAAPVVSDFYAGGVVAI
jgi:hypothetical protein